MSPAFLAKDHNDILRNALQKLATTTPLTAIAPGSIVRALAEVFTNELGDMYSLIDFNTSMSFLSTAQGRALDLIGKLFSVDRKLLSDTATIDQSVGAFYFYIDSPYSDNILIPSGTQVTTENMDFVGAQYVYQTTEPVLIAIGRTRAYASIRPAFADSVFTAGANTLVKTTFASPVGTTVRCTNPKPIQAQQSFEADDAYRARIQKAVRVAAGGTEEAIRFTALSVAGVRDISIRTAPYGLGSFEAVVIPESNSISSAVLVAAATAMDAIRPVGVRMFVRQPDTIPISISVTAIFKDVSNIDKTGIARRVEIGALRYLNTMLAGTTLIYNQLIQSMIDSSEFVNDVVVSSFAVNGVEALRRNVTVNDDEQIIPGTVTCTF